MAIPYQDSTRSIDERVTDLLSRMTLEEKVGQLNQRVMGWKAWERRDGRVQPTEAFLDGVRTLQAGAVYGLFRADPFAQIGLKDALSFREGAALANTPQRIAIGFSRLGIPLLFAEEALHLRGTCSEGQCHRPDQSRTANAVLSPPFGEKQQRQRKQHREHNEYPCRGAAFLLRLREWSAVRQRVPRAKSL